MGERHISIVWNPLQSVNIIVRVCVNRVCNWWTVGVLSVVMIGVQLYRYCVPWCPWLQTSTMFIYWALYWLILGVASSIGLGTGLHTFILYLAPHIAKIAFMSYQCQAIPIYNKYNPVTFDCPVEQDGVSVMQIIKAVQVESILWGLGTALGELPPYFLARAASIAKQSGEEMQELQEINEIQKQNVDNRSWGDWLKLTIYSHLNRHAFLTVLLCASIPNPLFDLAGITCGHFLVPFTVFFSACAIGKAIIKTHIQMLFVILAFSNQQIQYIINTLQYYLPSQKGKVQQMFNNYKDNLMHPENIQQGDKPLLGQAWDLFIAGMIIYFLYSILDSIVNSYAKEQNQKKKVKEQ